MELRRLRYFLAVAAELNISRAARRLHIAQPPLSRQIQLLEEEMGVALFRRAPRLLALTDAGRAFAIRARSVIEATESAVAHARQVHRQHCAHLCIGVHEGVVCTLLPALLSGFRVSHPEVAVEVKSLPVQALPAALAHEEIDLAFLRPGAQGTTTCSQPLWREPLVLAMAAEHPLAQQSEVRLAQCAPHVLIVHDSDYRDRILAACAEAAFIPRAVLSAESTLAALGMAASGLGIAFVPASMQRHRLDGMVFRTLVSPCELNDITHLAWSAAQASPALHAFVGFASTHASRNEASRVRPLKVVQAG